MQRLESKNLFGFSATGLSKLAFRARKLSGAFEKRAPGQEAILRVTDLRRHLVGYSKASKGS